MQKGYSDREAGRHGQGSEDFLAFSIVSASLRPCLPAS
jgi:hypothetical protein